MILFYLFASFWGKPKKVLFFATFCLHSLLFATFLHYFILLFEENFATLCYFLKKIALLFLPS